MRREGLNEPKESFTFIIRRAKLNYKKNKSDSFQRGVFLELRLSFVLMMI